MVHVSWMEGWREIANGEMKGKMREGWKEEGKK